MRLGTNNPPVGAIGVPADLTPDPTLQIPHAAAIQPLLTERITNAGCSGTCFSPRFARYLTLAQLDPGSGALLNSVARLTLVGPADNAPDLRTAILKTATFGSPANPAGHPVPRSGDGHVAFEELNGPETDLLSVPFPASTTPDVAPAPITTAASERMPAWSPDGLQLGFVRTTGGRRKLGVYDLTPGIQTIVNPLVDLGPDAPTPQTRAFQSIWGGMSMSAITAAPQVICDAACIARLRNAIAAPTIIRPAGGVQVGIFVVRRTGGTRTMLGVEQPKISVVGRVPLGKAKRGRNRFRWDGKVAGKRLKPGKYLLTYRLLRDEKVTTLSKSVPFTVRR